MRAGKLLAQSNPDELIRAFGVLVSKGGNDCGIYYLLQPVTRRRFSQALLRARTRSKETKRSIGCQLSF